MTGTEVKPESAISSGLSMPGSSTEGTGLNKGTGYSLPEEEATVSEDDEESSGEE